MTTITETDPTTMTTATTGRTPRAFTDAERQAWIGVGALVFILGLIGLALSFRAVSSEFRPEFGLASWAIPVGADIGIFAFSGLSILIALRDMPMRWVKVVPIGLTGATVWFNVASAHSWVARGAHALMPVLWVLAVEAVDGAIRHHVGLVKGTRMDRVRASRWLLAPVSTFRLWRRMRLWEITSYGKAVGREHEMRASRALLREWHGPRWHRTAPSAQRLAVALQASTDRPVAELLTEAAAGIMAAANAAQKPSDSASDNSSETDSNSDSAAASGGQVPARNRTGGRPKTGQTAAARTARIAAKNPDSTVEQIAVKAKVSPRTVRRHLATADTPAGAPSVEPVTHANGHQLAEQAA